VLAVDDNHVCLEILRDELSTWGFAVETVSSGALALEALHAAAREKPPVHARPDRHADAQYDRHRTGPRHPRRCVAAIHPDLMVAPIDDPCEAEQMQQLGLLGCITKPVRQSQLFDRIADAMAGSAFPTFVNLSANVLAPVPPVQNAKILLAEDNEVNRMVAEDILSLGGYTVDAVGDGVAAIQAVLERQYDLVLMDCQMPGMDGLEATSRIRQLEQEGKLPGPRLAIIALTANASRATAKPVCRRGWITTSPSRSTPTRCWRRSQCY